MSLYKEQKKQLPKSAKAFKPGERKARKASQSKLKGRNIQMNEDVQQAKAKVPARQSKDLREKRGVWGAGNVGKEKPSPVVHVDPYKTVPAAFRPKYTPTQIAHKKTLFLKAMERGIFSCGIAARAADVSRNTILAWQDLDPTFKARCDELFETALDQIEETIRQTCLNLTQPHKLTGLLALLNAYRRERFAPMTRHEHTGPGGGAILAAVAVKVKGMTDDELRFELSKLLGSSLVQSGENDDR